MEKLYKINTFSSILIFIISVMVLVLTFGHFYEINNEEQNYQGFYRLNIVYISLAALFVTWTMSLNYNYSNFKDFKILLPNKNFIVIASITLLILSFFINDIDQPIINSSEITIWNYIKAIISLGVVLFTPGWLLFSIFLDKQDLILKITYSILLSSIIIIFISIIFYWNNFDFTYIKFIYIPIILSLWSLQQKNSEKYSLKFNYINKKIDYEIIIFALIVSTAVLISWAINQSHDLLLAGDAWTTIRPAHFILNSQSIFDAHSNYPITWSFMMSGLASISGIPIINTNSILFSLSSLVIVSFFLLGKYAFKLKGKILITSTIVYGFLGGLAWFIKQEFDKINFWDLSNMSQDMYFQSTFWNNLHFINWHLALAFAFTSIFSLFLAMKSKGKERIFLSICSSLFICLAFYTHILEAFYVVPILVFILLYERKTVSKYLLISFSIPIIILFLFLQVALDGFYLLLIEEKFGHFFTMLNLDPSMFVAFGFFAITIANVTQKISKSFFYFLGISLLAIYVLGIFFWHQSSEYENHLYLVNQLPWYFLTSKFGFVGGFAIISLLLGAVHEKWVRLGVVWLFLVFIIGSIWWGARILDYSYPVIAIAAAFSIITLHKKIINFSYLRNRTYLKKLVVISFLVIIVFSSSSYIYGVSHLILKPKEFESENIESIKWIYHNASPDSAILVSNSYAEKKSFSTSSLHKTFKFAEIDNKRGDLTFSEFIDNNKIEYTYNIDNPKIFYENGYSLDYVKEIDAPLARLIKSP